MFRDFEYKPCQAPPRPPPPAFEVPAPPRPLPLDAALFVGINKSINICFIPKLEKKT